MRRIALLAAAMCLLGVACGGSATRETQQYYDPSGLFTAQLPVDNDIVVMPAQQVSGAPSLLGGVLSLPPQPSPQASSAGFGGNFVQPVTEQDTAVYSVFAVQARRSKDLQTLASSLLSGPLDPRVTTEQPITVGDREGLLVVADHGEGANAYSDASAFFLEGTTGYWVRELFAPGEWDQRRGTFLELLRKFQPGVPPGVPGLILTRQGLEIRSEIPWPLG